MLPKLISLSLLVLCAPGMHAAIYSNRVLNAETKQPVAYANVSIPSKGIGTVTDEQGLFKLDIPEGADTLAVSMIGYTVVKLSVERLSSESILLIKKRTDLSEIVVKPKVRRHARLGNRTTGKSNTVEFSENRLGYGIGTLMAIKWSPAFIESVRVNIAKCSYDSLFLRLNIYEKDSDTFTSILHEPIYISVSKPNRRDGIQIDLKERHIAVSRDFLVSVEIVRNLGPGALWFCGTHSGSPTYILGKNQVTWWKVPVGVIGISAKVTD